MECKLEYMSKCCSYKIDKKEEITFLSYKGDIFISDIIKILKKLTSDMDYSPYFDEVSDFRNCNLIVDISELPIFVKFVKEQINMRGSRKNIYLTKTPNQVALTELFSLLLEKSPVKIHIVSTIEFVTTLLSRPDLDENKLKIILDEI